MKIPDNKNIIHFFKKYGLIVLIVIGLIIVAKVSLTRAFNYIVLARDTECVLTKDIKNMMYKDEFYKVESIKLYEALGKIHIELEKAE